MYISCVWPPPETIAPRKQSVPSTTMTMQSHPRTPIVECNDHITEKQSTDYQTIVGTKSCVGRYVVARFELL